MEFDLEVFGGFLEGCVGSGRDDHLWLGDVALLIGFVAGGETSHQY